MLMRTMQTDRDQELTITEPSVIRLVWVRGKKARLAIERLPDRPVEKVGGANQSPETKEQP